MEHQVESPQTEEQNPMEERQTEPEKPAALTIVIRTWGTVVIGVVMLAVGLLIGYLVRPAVAPEATPAAVSQELPTTAAGAPAPTTLSEEERAAQQQEFMSALIERTRHFYGDPDAPVTIIEFSDFQCPFCQRHEMTVAEQIDENYVQQGQVRVGYWHFAFLGEESLWAAEASECAADQNAFWEYHDLLFDRQQGENQGVFSIDNLKGFAADLGLDTEAFNECLDSDQYVQIVQSQTAAGQQFGVQSTPTFIINGQPIVGAQAYDAFEEVIEQELNN